MIRGEALYTPRSAWYVCFPGTSAKDRLANFKGPGRDGPCEQALAERTLHLFSALAEMGINDKAQLMTAGAAARSTMRAKVSSTDDEVKSAALAALGMEGGRVVDGGGSASREDSPELEDSPGVNREVSQELEDYPGVDREVSQELEDCAGGTPEISGCPTEEPVTKKT